MPLLLELQSLVLESLARSVCRSQWRPLFSGSCFPLPFCLTSLAVRPRDRMGLSAIRNHLIYRIYHLLTMATMITCQRARVQSKQAGHMKATTKAPLPRPHP